MEQVAITQLNLQDAIRAGEEGREDGIARANENASDRWKEEAMEAIRWTARLYAQFTSADVWTFIGSETHEPRAMGSMMRKAHTNGWIEPTDTFKGSTRPSQHRQPLRVWRSLLYEK